MTSQLFKEKREGKESSAQENKGTRKLFDATGSLTVVKRTGALVPFRKERIYRAIEAAFRDTKKVLKEATFPSDLLAVVEEITHFVAAQALSLASKGASLTVEGIQDIVEITLMHNGYYDVARDYIIYRDKHKTLREDSPQNLKLLRHDGMVVRFNPMKVASALEAAFCRSRHPKSSSPLEMLPKINHLTKQVVERAYSHVKKGNFLNTSYLEEEIERLLMEEGYFKEAKDYILHKASKQTIKFPDEKKESCKEEDKARGFTVELEDKTRRTLTERHLLQKFTFACRDLEGISPDELLELSLSHFYGGIKEHEVDSALLFAARSKIECDPAYSKVAARLLLDSLYRETLSITAADPNLKEVHREHFKKYLKRAIHIERLSRSLFDFDLDKLAQKMVLERDDLFHYLGLQTLYDRYFIHEEGRRLETPQIFWMRVAMGLSLKEKENKTERAIEFYDLLSQFYFISATPTLFNSGTLHSQLSSCFLSTVQDDLENIFKVISDDAKLSKWAGGIGNDWTSIRATGANIKGTNGKSQGVVPFLKVANDTALAVNQGGKRKGAICAYLEIWHLDFEEFLELRKNTGDDRRRTHDMHTAGWIPDLFMKRVIEEKEWTLFSPSDAPDLHDLYGEAFEKRYLEYERRAIEGEIKLHKQVKALDLWRKMLSMLFETGHPWLTFKDPSNIRSPQDHAGVIHNSNLCTEILLNTSFEETAVCNLGSLNLAAHVTPEGIDKERLERTIRTAVRMLDNVMEINFYPIPEAKHSNERHRPIGLGIMGFQDALYLQHISYASHEAVEFADRSMELISYLTLLTSSELAKERGPYPSYKGSKWDRGYLPLDTLELLAQERKGYLDVDKSAHLDWTPVKESIQRWGMRNCNTLAIAPTATIANIAGVTPSIEPAYKHLYVKSNLSGDFTICNPHLVNCLKNLKLWDKEMIDDLKYFDGSLAEIQRIPDEVKRLFLTAFEIDPEWIIECASRRQKWIDMGQSLNLYLSEPSGKKLSDMYVTAWKKGLKTTYYCRTLAATQIEKSTTDINKRGLQPRWMKSKSASANITIHRKEEKKNACNLGEECESCQ